MAVFINPYGAGCACARVECTDDCSVYKQYKPKPKPITHGDQLRAMSDEELAAWIETFAPSGTFQFWLNGKTWLQWMRQEAGRDERAD